MERVLQQGTGVIDGKYPWPGTEAMEGGHYARLKSDDPVNFDYKDVTITVKKDDGSTEDVEKRVLCSKKFDSIKGKEGEDEDEFVVELANMDEYLVPDTDTIPNGRDKNWKNRDKSPDRPTHS